MNIKDEQFSNLIKYSDYGNAVYSPEAVALRFAGILADITKRKASSADQLLWASVPQIGADAKRFDIVKDFSIRPSEQDYIINQIGKSELGGQVGVVTEVREIRKRDGRTAVQVEIVFFNHTVLRYGSSRKRKLEFISGTQIDTSVPAYLLKG
jgi:hypothetical protein